jgi:anti-anti-sigma regulatory factor
MPIAEALPDDVPFRVEQEGDERAVIRFAEYVDHRRTAELEEKLTTTIRHHQRTACDLRSTIEIDSDWLALLAQLTIEARAAGKRLGLVGLSDTLKRSADVLGLKKLELFDALEDVWK